jgi:hypothetical protein
VARHVGLHGELRVEQQLLHEGGKRPLRAMGLATKGFNHGWRKEREVDRIRPEVPARLESDALVRLTDRDPLGQELLLVGGSSQRQEVLALLLEEALFHLGIAQKLPSSFEGQEVAIKRGNEGVGVPLEEGLESPKIAPLLIAKCDKGKPLGGDFLRRLAPHRKLGCHRPIQATSQQMPTTACRRQR